jgi:hypothetical protein
MRTFVHSDATSLRQRWCEYVVLAKVIPHAVLGLFDAGK